MIRSLLLAACFCALALSCAEARPRSLQKMQIAQIGCSQPDMRPCGFGGHQLAYPAEGNQPKAKRHRHKLLAISSNEMSRHSAARPRAWCGWWLGRHLGMPSRALWRALEWRHVGRAAHGPAIGAVVIWSRGKGRGHVGIITGKTSQRWVVLSGNDGNAVRERVRSVSNAIAFRWP
jgi:uncharacterized protein (TIGR02594 family)